uniref:Uncharacterized protein n=1 Tax=Trichuris muris TaxID=70415 RepID=A0A5S6QGE6_TRIMR
MVLAKGLNFVPTPKEPPILDIIASVEDSLRSMEPTAAAHIKGAINNTLSSHRRNVTPNVTGLERRTLSELRRNDNIIITKADKGNVVVLMGRSTYDQKISTLLSNNIYKPIRFDPTDTIRRTLSALLKNFAMETGDTELCNIWQHIYYTNNTKCPELYDLPKIHKEGVPLRPVVSSINNVTSKLCWYLNTILRPLTGNRSSFVKNSKDFCNDIRQVAVATTEIMVWSYGEAPPPSQSSVGARRIKLDPSGQFPPSSARRRSNYLVDRPLEEPTDTWPMTRYPPPPDNATTTLLYVELPTGDGRQGSCSDAWPNSEETALRDQV